MKRHYNFIAGELDQRLTTADTTIISAGLQDLPDIGGSDYIAITIDPAGTPEIVHLTAHGNGESTGTIVRGQHGTSAREHSRSTEWEHTIIADDLTTLRSVVIDDTRPRSELSEQDQDAAVTIYDSTEITDADVLAERIGLFVYSRPEVNATTGRVSGLKVSGVPTGSVTPELSVGVDVHWDGPAGVTSKNLVAVYGHTGAFANTEKATAFDAEVNCVGVLDLATGYRLLDGKLQGVTNFALQMGDYQSQHRGPFAVGGATTTTPAGTGASIDLQHTDRALILNRLTTTQRNAITASDGMVVYNTGTDTIQVRADGAWSDVIDASGGTMTGTLTLSDASPAASQAYAQGLSTGIVWKTAARVATTGSITLADLQVGYTLDGVALATDDRVLLTAQATTSQNGLYIIKTNGVGEGAPETARTSDFDGNDEVVGAWIPVSAGTQSGIWRCTNTGTVTVGTTAITFEKLPIGSLTADGTSVTVAGNVIIRSALTGDVTASQGSSTTVTAKIRGVAVTTTAPANGSVLSYNSAGTELRWKPAPAHTYRLDDTNLPTAFALDGSTDDYAAWTALWALVTTGDTIIVPAGAAVKTNTPIFFDKKGVSLITDAMGGPYQTDDLAAIDAPRFIAGTTMPFIMCFEADPNTDNDRGYITVNGIGFDGDSKCRDVVVWNCRESLMENCTFTNLQDGDDLSVRGVSSGCRIGPDDTTIASVAGATSGTFTIPSGTLDDFYVVTGSKIGFPARSAATMTVTTSDDYYLRKTGSTTFTVHATRAAAIAGTGAILPTVAGTVSLKKSQTAQDVDISNCRAMGERSDGSYADFSAGFVVFEAADCSIKNNCKAVKTSIGTWINGATSRYVDNHPFNGGIGVINAPSSGGQTVGYADLVLAGQTHVVANNYFDNPGAMNSDGTEGSYVTSASNLTAYGKNGAHIVIDADTNWVRQVMIHNNMFNNGPGGTDTNPLIRIKNTSGHCVGLSIHDNQCRAAAEADDNAGGLNNDNGARNSNGTNINTSGYIRNGQGGDANSVFSAWDATGGGSRANHVLKNYQAVIFEAVPGGETTITTAVVYYIRHGATYNQQFTVHATKSAAIAGTGAITPNSGANASGWRLYGARIAAYSGMIVADKWDETYLPGLSVKNNTMRWLHDPRLIDDPAGDNGGVFWPYVDLANPSRLPTPHTYGGNRWGTSNDITDAQAADTNIFTDSVPPTVTKILTADTAAVTTTSLTTVDALTVALEANTTYIVDGFISYTAPSDNTNGDYRYCFSSITGATMVWSTRAAPTSASGTTAQTKHDVTTTMGTAQQTGGLGTSTDVCCHPMGTVFMSTTPGNIKFLFSLGAGTDGTGAVTKKGSWLRFTPVASKLIGP